MNYIGYPDLLKFQDGKVSYLKPYEVTTPKMYIKDNGELESKTYLRTDSYLMENEHGTVLVLPGSSSCYYSLTKEELENFKKQIK